MVENGLTLMEGGKQKGSYYSTLIKEGVKIEDLGGFSAWVDEDFKPIS